MAVGKKFCSKTDNLVIIFSCLKILKRPSSAYSYINVLCDGRFSIGLQDKIILYYDRINSHIKYSRGQYETKFSKILRLFSLIILLGNNVYFVHYWQKIILATRDSKRWTGLTFSVLYYYLNILSENVLYLYFIYYRNNLLLTSTSVE